VLFENGLILDLKFLGRNLISKGFLDSTVSTLLQTHNRKGNAMLRFERIGRLRNGRNPEGIMWAKEITEYLKANYSQASFQTYMEVFGDVHAICWHADLKDFAAWDGFLAKLMTDQQYWTIVKKGMEFFIDGSFKDRLMSMV
jgi:hypothetical protein